MSVSKIIDPDAISPRITVCALLYGDNLFLAKRCLDSIAQLPTTCELRVGMNATSADVQKYVTQLHDEEAKKGRSVRIYSSSINRGKYPIMRCMFHDLCNVITTPLVMWFDDDSFIKTPTVEWLQKIDTVMRTADVCGCLMQCGLEGNQHLWIQMQPWYNGKPICTGQPLKKRTDGFHVPGFAVGGWFVVKMSALKQLDWPPQNIVHRGGDFMFGEAMRQHGMKLVHFCDGVSINADEKGADHKMARRGLDPLPVGVDYVPSLVEQLHFATKEIDPILLDYPNL